LIIEKVLLHASIALYSRNIIGATMKNVFTLVVLLICSPGIQAQKKKIEGDKINTITYFKNDTLSLELNLFVPKGEHNKKLPLLIYAHGGGFSTGKRADGDTLCMKLADNGFLAATITYTLYMTDKSFGCDGIVSEKIRAMQFAANNLWQATAFFINNQEKYNVDIAKIFVAGSSAGAETALHATFWDFNTMNMYNTILPADFKYAGLIAGSGAVMDINLITDKNKIPMMMFHGSADKTVPYATGPHRSCKTNARGWLIFFGSFSIYNHLLLLNSTARLFTFCGGGHEYSGELFYKNPKPVLDFLNDVINNNKFQEHIIVATGKNADQPTPYKFCE
jgi:poly(3-hydroxybutyrate) depolymerase